MSQLSIFPLALLTLVSLACATAAPYPTPTSTPAPAPPTATSIPTLISTATLSPTTPMVAPPTQTSAPTAEVTRSIVVADWVIKLNGGMPDVVSDSSEWKAALTTGLSTTSALEAEYLDMIMDDLWTVVLPSLQPIADRRGFGDEWKVMCTEKTRTAANAVEQVIWDAKQAGRLDEGIAETAGFVADAVGDAASGGWGSAGELSAASRAADAMVEAAWLHVEDQFDILYDTDPEKPLADALLAAQDYTKWEVVIGRIMDRTNEPGEKMLDETWATFDPAGLLNGMAALK